MSYQKLQPGASGAIGQLAAVQAAMQAVVCHGPKDYRLETVNVPTIGPNELLISIAACGICASDCKCHSGAKMFWGGDGQPSWVKAP
jgi:NADPH:quinone reductase-like Zn-dependent oxidoreductase